MIRLKILIAVGILLFTQAAAQPSGLNLDLPPSFKSGDIQWVDFDNDGLLDILLLSTDQSGNAFLNIIKGDTSAATLEINKTRPIIPFQAYALIDYNLDNKMDLLVSGLASTTLYINRGEFNFEEKSLTIAPFLLARFADVDNNASRELLVTGESNSGFYFQILRQEAEYTWKIVHDSIDMKCTSIEILDADGDGDNDLFISGELKADSMMSGFLINESEFYFKPQHTISFKGKTATGDLDNDGFFEVMLVGEDGAGKKFIRASHSYTISDLSVPFKNSKTFIADLTFDGKADIIYSGIDSSGEPAIETVLSNGMDSLIVHRENTIYGDLDHDGRLDAVSLMEGNTFLLSLLVNKVAKSNAPPSKPSNAVALPIFNRVFMYWDKPTDDHTPQASLTYDVTLKGVSNYQVGEFDLLNNKRLTVTHGNNGTNNFMLLKDVESTDLNFSIQAIDNSFHAGTICAGQGHSECADIVVEEIASCPNSELILSAPPGVLWFSFAKGFLGKTNQLSIIPDETDTIFYFNPASVGCGAIKTWKVNVENPDLKVSAEHYKIIKGTEVQLLAEGAERYIWSPETGLDRADIANPIASPLASIIYTVTGFDSNGCLSSATVNITVEDTSFIPTLFSPNEDGQNDQLKIYGLSGAQNFSFTVYDREGALVYKTSEVSEVVQNGWDGTKNGTKQPTGVYFWKVRGENSAGQVLLNGKGSGSVVLIR